MTTDARAILEQVKSVMQKAEEMGALETSSEYVTLMSAIAATARLRRAAFLSNIADDVRRFLDDIAGEYCRCGNLPDPTATCKPCQAHALLTAWPRFTQAWWD